MYCDKHLSCLHLKSLYLDIKFITPVSFYSQENLHLITTFATALKHKFEECILNVSCTHATRKFLIWKGLKYVINIFKVDSNTDINIILITFPFSNSKFPVILMKSSERSQLSKVHVDNLLIYKKKFEKKQEDIIIV